MHTAHCLMAKAGSGICSLAVTIIVGMAAQSATAAGGDTTLNGTVSAPPGIVVPGFLFEPEVPLNSLKTVPIWNELEQLLDNPYKVALCSALPVDPLIRTTPGTTQITGSPPPLVFPAYCSNSSVLRRPAFGVTLPPLMVHPLNYNATTGEEMRLLSPDYPGGRWVVPGELLQCGTPEATADASVRPLCALRGNNPNVWLQSYHSVTVTPGAGRVAEAEINDNAPIRADVSNFLANMYAGAASSTTASGLLTATALQDITLLGGHCVATTEPFPAPEGATACGGDPGEPGGTANGISGPQLLPSFGVNRANGYSRPAIPGVPSSSTPLTGASTGGPVTARLFDATRATPGHLIQPRDASTGAGGLRKPSLRVPEFGGSPSSPNYLWNVNADATAPSNENDYIRNREVAAALGKALFWDMQVGSDSVQSCGSCHAHAAADNRVKNQINPNHLGGDLNFEVRQPNESLTVSDFPFQKLINPNVAGDPKCTSPLVAHVNAGLLENTPNTALTGAVTNGTGTTMTVCNAANVINTKNNASGAKVANDVASSMGVHWGIFKDVRIGQFGPPSLVGGVRSALPDTRETATDCAAAANPTACLNSISDPIPGFAGAAGTGEPGVNNQFRRVEPRNTPVIIGASLNFDNFWDGRANHDFNGGSVFGSSDPQSHVFVDTGNTLTPTRQIIRFVSMASLATGPGLSEFEMSFLGRNWSKIGKKLLQAGATPLANQLVDPNDSLLGIYSNQHPIVGRSPLCTDPTPLAGKPGLCTSYNNLIAAAYYPALHANSTAHLIGCYTDGRTEIHPNQCGATVGSTVYPAASVTVLENGDVVSHNNDPFDGYVLTPAAGAVDPLSTNEFTQMEGNFSLFWGLSLITWANNLMADNTPFDQFVDRNPDAFEAIGEVGEAGLVGPMPLCSGLNAATQRHCIRQIGNFKRDSQALATATRSFNCAALPGSGETGGTVSIPAAQCYGTRTANDPDPLLGMDIFQGSNISLKNPNFRAGRCGECHAGGTLTDNTTSFTTKTQLGDFIGEFVDAGNEALIEPLGMTRVISGFLAEDELNGNGQDAIERRIANQSIVPCPADGLAYPGGLDPGSGQGFGPCSGAAQALFDNGVYNLGVTRCEADQSGVVGVCDDNGHGNTDAFGWPLSHAAKLLKNLGGPAQEPGVSLANFDPDLGGGGGLFEETSQDQSINPGDDPEEAVSQLPPYMGPFMAAIVHGDSMPEMDEVFAGLNTLTDVGMLEGFVDNLGPFNNAGILNEAMNNGEGPQMGTWPIVNRVSRFGSMKAAQLREVEVTGPYFHNGGKLTLRQVVDFYMRGGDFPVTNAMHRDFNMINQNIEVQSNVSEAEKVALVDFLLELTDERVRFERAPFDHPQVILPLDGTAPENTGRDNMLAGCVLLPPNNILGPGQSECAGGMFLDVPAVGSSGNPMGPIPSFLGIAGRSPDSPGVTGRPIKRLSGAAANCAVVDSHYCH